MKYLLLALLAVPAAAQAGYDDPFAAAFSSAAEPAPPAAAPGPQETPEELAELVLDYIRREILLKGSFLIEERESGRVLKLNLLSCDNAAKADKNGNLSVTAFFRETSGREREASFRLGPGAWGSLEILRIELRPRPRLQGAPAKGAK